ncbi:TPA: hypothetical protein JJF93_001161 [Salmonella enterica]|uniref:Uncharacterized protein n=4 Tax=Salmonella enterica TaxID=28901 RepID=A0A5U0FMW9_SALER|nr:hypothetical protein CHC41_19500 [Salmonella enterica]EAA7749524.1 hypothetical protein [Salmonella enterica subsp. enterica serovar Virchow]EAB0030677.1 hypothetical protein [Salmonella enterica subsp. enterica]EAS0638901.1 hypothetical protein [Salmonella enterica subsp. enterica serovar Cotham]EBF2840335.1 hypothetical protein [Salmonella enterica subsp. enterica serovar Agona]EBH3547183.1 hypothetical protein [Salmonella enterica subsp. enterica serovar Infantis]EBO2288142.1 hypothetic
MQRVHCFACAGVARSGRAPPVLARIQSGHATALNPPHKVGRRGGESIARQSGYISVVKLVTSSENRYCTCSKFFF